MNSIRYQIQPVVVETNGNTIELASIVVSQDFDDSTEKTRALKSLNDWVELPIAANCTLVKFEADNGLSLREGTGGPVQEDVTFFLKRGTIPNSFFVKNTTSNVVNFLWNTLGEE